MVRHDNGLSCCARLLPIALFGIVLSCAQLIPLSCLQYDARALSSDIVRFPNSPWEQKWFGHRHRC